VRSRRAPVAPDADATLQRLVDRAAGREPSGPRPPDAGYGDIVEAARHTTTRPAASSASVAFAPMVQRTTGSRTCTCGATEPCSCADLDHPVQRQGAGDVATVAARDVAPSGPGRPLEPGIRAEFEHSFDHDFSDVRIHTGASAANAASAAGAIAYTLGRDIVFSSGAYAPETPTGKRLVAHELTHVVQQSSGTGELARTPSASELDRLGVSHPHDRAEQEAEQISNAMVDASGDLRAPESGSVNERPASPVQCEPDPKKKHGDHKDKPAADHKDKATGDHEKDKGKAHKPSVDLSGVTVDNVEARFGPLTAEIAERVLQAYGSPLADHAQDLVSAFANAWIGLAIMMQESSFGNSDNNPGIDERNVANPFSVHFTAPAKWPAGCKRNALLKPEKGATYEPSGVPKECAARDHRLAKFAESAAAAAKVVAKGNLDAYREAAGYTKDINARIRDILRKIHLEPKK